jgi:hypothetical protein
MAGHIGRREFDRDDIFLPDDDLLDEVAPSSPPVSRWRRGRTHREPERPRRESHLPVIPAELDELTAPEAIAPLLPESAEDSTGAAVVSIWAEVARECRSCKDFRPSEQPDRGWCTNKFAFATRRMVDAGDCPCETSIGSWWIPSDQVWVASVDVGTHAAPTPLVDRLEARRAAAQAGAEAPVRRRQRS